MAQSTKDIEKSKQISVQLTKEDFSSDQDVRWCPGCGDYSILAQVKKVLPELGIPREQFVFISGIGCSSRFPYYLNVYGVHSIHGRAPTIATGVKLANPDLSVWIVTGDGDGLSIGGNHLIHIMRRNLDVNIILFNNEIYGLTKGQYSPTTPQGQITKSSPFGSIDPPFNPIQLALGAGATFVARTIDRDPKHMVHILKRAAEHKGVSFVEVYQNCNIFNDGAYAHLTEPDKKPENALYLEDGKPMIFGKNNDKGIRLSGFRLEKIDIQDPSHISEVLVHNEHPEDPALAFLIAEMTYNRELPTPLGVFQQIEKETYDELFHRQIEDVTRKYGEGDIHELLLTGDTWRVD